MRLVYSDFEAEEILFDGSKEWPDLLSLMSLATFEHRKSSSARFIADEHAITLLEWENLVHHRGLFDIPNSFRGIPIERTAA